MIFRREKPTLFESVTQTLALIALGKLQAREAFMEAGIDKLMSICNGCGAANAKFDFVPDTIYGLDVGPVCNIHDFDYHVGRTEGDRLRADLHMLQNLLLTIEATSSPLLKPLRRIRALSYYQAVREFGASAFLDGKEP